MADTEFGDICGGSVWHNLPCNCPGLYIARRVLSRLRPWYVNYITLTNLPFDKMAAFSQTICSDALSWMKSFVFGLKFHWILFPMVQLKIMVWRRMLTWFTDIYAALGGEECRGYIETTSRYFSSVYHRNANSYKLSFSHNSILVDKVTILLYYVSSNAIIARSCQGRH